VGTSVLASVSALGPVAAAGTASLTHTALRPCRNDGPRPSAPDRAPKTERAHVDPDRFAAEPVGRGVRFEVLGPLAVSGNDGRAFIGSHREQTALALLVLEAGQVVASERLIDAIWDDDPPATARAQVHICLSALRRTLANAGAGDLVQTVPQGYALRRDGFDVDAAEFAALAGQARRLAPGTPSEAGVSTVRRALGLWRGAALEGLRSPVIRAKAARLDEERLALLELCMDWELGLGRHRGIISELAEQVSQHPLRERLRCLLMTALHRSGRQSEALEVYRRGRAVLVGQLGLEPGEDLRALHAAILANDPALMPPPQAWPAETCPVPRQLPADVVDFTGRRRLVADLCERLAGSGAAAADDTSLLIVALAGPGGVGKSATAVHAARTAARADFRDGQLYADLRGSSALEPRDPAEVLRGFLRALGVIDAAIPDSLDERAALYRTRTADRRMLVVLDDAAGADQVTPLLPGGSTCAVLLTSRSVLSGVDGVRALAVEPLPDREAIELLESIVGADRMAGQERAAQELAGLLEGSPLAMRAVATQLLTKRHWSLSTVVARLRREELLLDELSYGRSSVRAVIDHAYRGLSTAQSRFLDLLVLLKVEEFPARVAAEVLELDVARATDLVETLVDAQMLTARAGDPAGEVRYRLRGLVRAFVRERLTGAAAGPCRPGETVRRPGGMRPAARRADVPTMLLPLGEQGM
jgi:DNA-binding SARP family transcriptional activator